MSIIGIVAIDRNLAIGKNGKLPWHYSADMKFFKETTLGNAVVMGRRTWLTLKGPLPNRLNIVLTRHGSIGVPESVRVLNVVESVIELGKAIETDLFVVGGARVNGAFLLDIDRWLVTEVPLSVAGADTVMPRHFLQGFEMYETRQLDEGLRVKCYERRVA